VDLNTDFFALFRLPRSFRVSLAELDERYREMQHAVHPDRFAAASERERRLSMQWSVRVNEAYQTLKTPLLRAQYLIQLARHDSGSEAKPVLDADFLMEQMEWREAVMGARTGRDHHELERLEQRLRHDLVARYETLAALLDDARDYPAAVGMTQKLMFLEKLETEIGDALAALDDEGAFC